MRCPACQADNPEEYRYCEACGASLMRSCSRCGHANRASAKFCSNCGAALAASATTSSTQRGGPLTYTPKYLAERILSARTALEGERKQVTVLFADIKGSTELIEGLDAEQAAKRLAPALKAMMDAVHRFEGTVNKVQGDGIMALFGAPLAHEDHAVRACYAALAMQQALKKHAEQTLHAHGFEMQARVGLHSGDVLVRAIGNDLSMDYDAIGPTVHLANRMEQLAVPGTVRLTIDTLHLAEGFVEVRSLGAVPIKGINEPVEVCELVGAAAVRTRLEAAAARGLTRFVGRDSELQVLRRAEDQARHGHGQVVALVGEPGVGKSRLFYEFTHSQRVQDLLILEGRSVSYGKATAWLPVIELLKSYFRIEARDDVRSIREKVTGKVLALDESLKSVLPALLSLFDLGVEDVAWRTLDPAQRRRRTLDAVKALLLRESEEQSLVVMFEDLHWADGETLELLSGLIDSLPAHRILLFVNYRPEFHHDWGGRGCYAQVRVDPLPAQGAEAILDALLGTDLKLLPLKRLLADRAKGNPLFIEESLRALVEAGTLTGEPGAYGLTRDIDTIEVPATVQAIIAARIDRLPPVTKQLLQSAAAVGHDVPYAVLQAIAEIPEDQMRQGLSDLQAAEFLYETRLFPDPEYAFKHAFTHEVAYGGVLRDRRRELHRRVGEAIETLYRDRHVAFAESLADHFDKGEVWAKAASHYLRAADKAKNQWAYGRGAGACRKALACLEHTNGLEGEKRRVLVMLGDLLSLEGELDQANESYDRALVLTEDDPGRRFIDNKRHRPGCAVRDGARIAYYEHGSGADVLVLVSPLAYDTTAFQPLVETLCQEFRIVQIFPRGTGPSDPAPYPYRFENHVEDARTVIRNLGSNRVTGIGTSRGGSLLVRLACADRTLLNKIVLIGTSLGDTTIDWGRKVNEILERQGIGAVAAALVREIITEPGTEDLAKATIRRLSLIGHDTWLNFLDPGVGVKIAPLLTEVKVPTLVIHGTDDRAVPFEQGRYIASRIPDAQLCAFEGKGHLPIYTATHEFCDVLRQFVRTGTVSKLTPVA